MIVPAPREITFEKLQSTNLAPISPGTINVHAHVDLTYEITPTPERARCESPLSSTVSGRKVKRLGTRSVSMRYLNRKAYLEPTRSS